MLLEARGWTACGAFDAAGKAECRDSAGNPAWAHLTDMARQWNRALAVGVSQRPQGPMAEPTLRSGEISAAIDKRRALSRVGPTALEVTFAPCPKMVDGRHANNTWLQEMPDPVTKLVWDNAAILSPTTAKQLGVKNKDVVTIALGSRSIRAGVWV